MRKIIIFCLDSINDFWRRYPGLFYGFSFFIGISMAIQSYWSILFPFFLIRARLWLAFFLIAMGFFYIQLNYQRIDLPENGMKGEGVFSIENLSLVEKSFGKTFKYSGTLDYFTGGGRQLPCVIYHKDNFNRPKGNGSYFVKGHLHQRSSGNYILKINKDEVWHPVKGTWSLAECRYQAKTWITKYIHSHIKEMQSAEFLTGIFIGEFNDPNLSYHLGKLGLQHILAISGFHFSILATIISLILRLFLSPKVTAIAVIILLTSYFTLIGWSPSVQRAWVMALIFFSGYLFERKSHALNSLGVALIVICIVSPLHITHIGFIFSFLATAAILLFYEQADHMLQKVIQKRSLAEMIEKNALNQHSYVLATFFRKAIALTIAVHLVAIPTMLYFFHKFPLLSLIYNLFFPFLVTFSMLLLILSFAIPVLHVVNQLYTTLILNFIQAPLSLNYTLYTTSFPLWLYIICLFILALSGILLHRRSLE